MKAIDPTTLSSKDNYKFLIGSIIPRPIAFVTTITEEGVVNAAPFSFFNIVSASPPLLAVSVQRAGGTQKDTARNAISQREFVVHISAEHYVEAINETAAALPPHESEVARAGLTTVPSTVVSVPGIKEASIRMECVLEQALPLGESEDGEPACDLLIGKVVHYHITEELYKDGKIDPHALKPVSRLAGNDYAKLGEIFTIERPS
ncbi:hypothetical protein A374_02679 [Fictibacillus macauensis ZFHKF-1]|uniref:Flavin reductase like domain-containing protein n=1 Tax=Fictibacillus macauensis ZFHKF-1 TaxID=1196324 RepID=I8UJX2_9BACL|nr:flavin reductase family protein [Fictibacillus macauensis]EIT87123.1 hypothetical protein A374_02679 [Fictibacillus macauensis ZFHKF-1]